MTLKMFKQADFENIANLNKTKNEDKAQFDKVEKSAKKHIKLAGGIYAGCLAFAGLLLSKGEKSKALQNLSELIVAPGTKLFKNNSKARNFFDKFLSLDFAMIRANYLYQEVN